VGVERRKRTTVNRVNRVAIIIPTYQERDNLAKLVPELFGEIERVDCDSLISEIIIVDDDSRDGTNTLVEELQACLWKSSIRLHLITRVGERGLGSAVRRGANVTTSPYCLVMDGDGQHRAKDAIAMIRMRAKHESRLVTGSRFISDDAFNSNIIGSRIIDFPWYRKLISQVLNWLARGLSKTKVSDPMTGLFIAPTFMIRETITSGFKILFDILQKHRFDDDKDHTIEFAITFETRKHGSSKADFRELLKVLSR